MTLVETINNSLNAFHDDADPSDTDNIEQNDAANLRQAFNSPAVLAALEALPPEAQDALKEVWEVCSAF